MLSSFSRYISSHYWVTHQSTHISNLFCLYICKQCLDFKIITSLVSESFESWEQDAFKPEADFITRVSAIEGVSAVETQTYTIMPVR